MTNGENPVEGGARTTEEPRDASFYLGLIAGAGGAGRGGATEGPEILGDLESVPAPSGPDLSDSRIQQSVEATGEMLRKVSARPELHVERHEAVVRGAQNALAKLAQEGEQAAFSPEEQVGLEAVVIADGTRPVLFVQDGKVDPAAPDAGQWKKALESLATKIDEVTQSVGGIKLAGDPPPVVGTGWVVAPGLIVTNRHVAQGIATEQSGGAGPSTWTLNPGVTVDFAGEFERTTVKSFKVTGVAFAGPDPIVRDVKLDLTHLDMAVLRCEVPDGQDFPPALTLESDPTLLVDQRSVYVMGFPAKKAGDFAHVITDLFKDTLGFKRWAPGLIKTAPGETANDTKSWVATHDASTLGGNSGSCVIDFGNDGARVVGLHFGGRFRTDNFAHAIAKLQEELQPLGGSYV